MQRNFLRLPSELFGLALLLAGLVADAAVVHERPAPPSGQEWWSFQPLRHPPIPAVKLKRWPINAIDQFVLATLESKGLNPNPPATKRELIRRVYFDLVGLPPAPHEIQAFEQDTSPEAYERLIDCLLASPQYGERWARHWLDVVRYAQSNGYERDAEKPMAWRYRDYVIQALNEDKPFDRFILEQLAGDELPDADFNSIIATGFQRLGVWDDEPDDKQMAEYDELDDILATTGAAFLGLTLNCARCHEHKFDPIPQSDYYKLLAFFRNVRPYDSAAATIDSPKFVPLATRAELAKWQTQQSAKTKAVETQLTSTTDEGEKKKLTDRLASIKSEPLPFECALAVRESGTNPPLTHVLLRGNARNVGTAVQPAFLNVLGSQMPTINPTDTSSGRRLALAKWIASPENPLTARVLANRLWHHHFGRGIVRTTTDFGRAGSLPTNPQLLDYLADKLIFSGWSIKRVHREIVLSATYRMSSRAQDESASRIDPDNQYLWRQNLRRLDAETLRDSLLYITGQLNCKMGGRGFFPHLAGEVLAGASRPGLDWEVSSESERSRRTIYSYVRRTVPVPFAEIFDYSNTTSPLGERPTTTVAPQALLLLNDEFLNCQSAALSLRLASEMETQPAQIRRAYQLVLGRELSFNEQSVATAFLDRQAKRFALDGPAITFRPDVPPAIEAAYFNRLKPSDFLRGPPANWTYCRGEWAPAYEGIRAMERFRGPFALWHASAFSNGVLETAVVLHNAAEYAELLFHGSVENDKYRGYGLLLDVRQQQIALQHHGTNTVTVTSQRVSLPTDQPLRIILASTNNHLTVWLNSSAPEHPLIDAAETASPFTGSIGIRAWGAPVTLKQFNVTTRSGTTAALPGCDNSSQRALQSWCLLLLNLNEMLYVD